MSKNLLVYEADKANAEKLAALFEQFGFSVFTVASENEVMEVLNKTQINAFIVRAENPAMQGFMLCKKIRGLSQYANRPILLISSNSDETAFDRHRNFDYHADYYLKIPTDDETLLASLNAVYPFLDALAAEENAEEVAALKGKIAEDGEKIDSLGKQVSEQENMIQKLTETNKKLEEDLANAAKIEDETGELKEAIVQKGLRIKNLEENNAELEEKLKILGNVSKEKDELKKQLDAANAEKDALSAGKAKAEDENKKLSETVAEKTKKIETLEAKLGESEKALKNSFTQKDIDELKKKINELKDQNDVLSVYNKEMKERVKKAEESSKKAETEKEKSAKTLEELKKSSAEEKEAMKNDYEKKIAEKEKLIQESESESAELKDTITNLTIIADEFEKTRQEKTELEKVCGIQKGQIEELGEALSRAAEITDQNDELVKENESLKAKNNEKIERIKELNTQIDKLMETKEAFDAAASEIETLKKEAEETQAKLAQNASEISEKTSKIEALEKEIDTMKKEAAKFDALKEQLKHLAGDFEAK